jgi:hypothetical protein
MEQKLAYRATLLTYANRGETEYGFRYTDHRTGRSVEAKISGGRSNVDQIRRYIGPDDDWDRTILTHPVITLSQREMDRLPYAGCTGKELAEYIKRELAKPLGEE